MRSFSAIVFESLPSRSRIAAASQSTVGGAHRTVRCSLVAGDHVPRRAPEAGCPSPVLPRIVVVRDVASPGVDQADAVLRLLRGHPGDAGVGRFALSTSPARRLDEWSQPEGIEPVGGVRPGSGAKRRRPAPGQLGPAHLVSRATLQPETDAIAADRPAQDGDTVHVLAGDADPGEARRHRVTALQHHAGEVDPGARRPPR